MTSDALEINYAPKYSKVSNLFKRDPKGAILYGEFASEAVKYLKYAKWIVQEKIDGTNVRIIWDGDRVTFGGKNSLDPAQLPPRLLLHLTENYGTPEFEQVIEQEFGETPITLYGEGYGHKIQTGAGYFPDDPEGRNEFIGFDVRINGRYASSGTTARVLDRLGVPRVTEMPKTMTIPEAVEYLFLGVSYAEKYGGPAVAHENTSKEIEGVVLRSGVPLYDQRGNRVMTKIILSDLRKVREECSSARIADWLL